MRHGSLFSGIGGFDLASEWMGWENIFQVEWDKYCQKILAKNFPKVKRYEDIKQFDGSKYNGAVDIITGGFPCQPFSQAGKRKGTEDDRYLWPEMLRVIREIKPAFVVGENVAGLLSLENGKTLETIFTDLEDEGYKVESFIIPACATGAWHRRDRIWVCAHSNSINSGQKQEESTRHNRWKTTNDIGQMGSNKTSEDASNTKSERKRSGISGEKFILEGTESGGNPIKCSSKNASNTNGTRCKTWEGRESRGTRGWSMESNAENRGIWELEPNVGRVANGIPSRVDRLKGLGNAIVPQVAYEIFKAIEKL